MSEQLHRVQVSILDALRHTEAARFSTLMRPTGLQSDTFKFHLRKLSRLGYVEKTEAGRYQLTAQGKEFANNLDKTKHGAQRQPKLSILLVVPMPEEQKQNSSQPDDRQYLFQRRQRNPFFGFWSCIGGPIQWGEGAEETAARELKKQTGLNADCKVRSFYRKRDYDAGSQKMLEDKLFIILEATDVSGELTNTWYGGVNQWMTVSEFKQQPKYFSSVCEAIDILRIGHAYTSKEERYDLGEY